jgi:hypothetical protein
MFQQTGPKLGVSRGIDMRRVSHGAFEQSIETIVITGKVAVNFSGHRKCLSMIVNPGSVAVIQVFAKSCSSCSSHP